MGPIHLLTSYQVFLVSDSVLGDRGLNKTDTRITAFKGIHILAGQTDPKHNKEVSLWLERNSLYGGNRPG